MTIAECQEKIEECFDNGTLTKWEDSFLTSLAGKLSHGWSLSEREEELLEGIHAKIYGR